LNCGVTQTPIFAELDPEKNEWVGLDVDFCKAISAAIFDGTIDVKYEVLSPGERFKALQDGRVDVLARVTTITLERDRMGVSFSYSNFRDEIRFAGTPRFRQCAENLDWNSGDCSDLRVCVTEKTTQFDLLTDIFPASRLHVTNSSSETVESFGNGKCNALAGGSVETSQASIQKWYSGPYDIGKSFSRESLALVTLEEDPLWSKFVNWIVVATLYAEEQGIGRATYLKMPRVDLFRPLVGDEMLRNAIRAVGSYAEIWDRNAGSNGLIREGRNLLNTYPLGPLLISDQNWDMPAVRGDPNNN
jgi:general L-amino acid transport system substrate-binding protein